MNEIIIITTLLLPINNKFYLFDKFIVKEYSYEFEGYKDNFNTKYEIYDIETRGVTIVSLSGDRLFREKSENLGNWTDQSKTLIKQDIKNIVYDDFNCLQLTKEYSSDAMGSNL